MATATIDASERTDDERADGSAPSATRRRRRRGGRGRSGRGRTSGASEVAGDTEPADDAAEPTEAADTTELAEGQPQPARRRRRRGGRRRSGSSAAETAADDDAGENSAVAEEESTDAEVRPARPRTRRRPAGTAEADRPAGRTRSGAGKEPKAEGRPRATRTAARAKVEEDAKESPGRSRRAVKAEEPPASTRLKRQRQSRQVRRRRDVTPAIERVTDKLMAITEHGERDQIAVLEGRDLVQHYVTRRGARSMVGNVYLGKVQNVLPGMEAAFVDVGRGRNAVLYAGEVNWSPEDLEGAPPRIEHVLKSGQSVLVQVTKDPIGGKGARLTAQLSLPGRYLVLAPNSNVTGISRRLPDAERRRLKGIYKGIKPDEHGLIVRTAAEGATEEALAADFARLLEEWKAIEKRAKRSKAPSILYEEPELTVRAVRDLFTDEEYRELVTDSPRVYELITDYLRAVAPDLLAKVRLHTGPLPVFEEFHIVEQIHKGLDRKVWLPSGGYLIIERTEALTVIDVNTGKAVGKSNLEETVVNTNVEAAREIARQLRLRDIGGMIVIDFIDMLLEQNKSKVIDAMKEALAQDKSRSQVFDISPLGLLEVTRKRVSGGLLDAFSETCPTCEGRGLIVTYDVN
ncbi:MAG TPA: Rne/Rng family ribonuclease [Actinomycetota bacterium]|nr:Rne/Rng family ribonuclease [Actinomycetota bacterium]